MAGDDRSVSGFERLQSVLGQLAEYAARTDPRDHLEWLKLKEEQEARLAVASASSEVPPQAEAGADSFAADEISPAFWTNVTSAFARGASGIWGWMARLAGYAADADPRAVMVRIRHGARSADASAPREEPDVETIISMMLAHPRLIPATDLRPLVRILDQRYAGTADWSRKSFDLRVEAHLRRVHEGGESEAFIRKLAYDDPGYFIMRSARSDRERRSPGVLAAEREAISAFTAQLEQGRADQTNAGAPPQALTAAAALPRNSLPADVERDLATVRAYFNRVRELVYSVPRDILNPSPEEVEAYIRLSDLIADDTLRPEEVAAISNLFATNEEAILEVMMLAAARHSTAGAFAALRETDSHDWSKSGVGFLLENLVEYLLIEEGRTPDEEEWRRRFIVVVSLGAAHGFSQRGALIVAQAARFWPESFDSIEWLMLVGSYRLRTRLTMLEWNLIDAVRQLAARRTELFRLGPAAEQELANWIVAGWFRAEDAERVMGADPGNTSIAAALRMMIRTFGEETFVSARGEYWVRIARRLGLIGGGPGRPKGGPGGGGSAPASGSGENVVTRVSWGGLVWVVEGDAPAAPAAELDVETGITAIEGAELFFQPGAEAMSTAIVPVAMVPAAPLR